MVEEHPVVRFVRVGTAVAGLREEVAEAGQRTADDAGPELEERARRIVEDHAPAGNAWPALVAIRRRCGKRAAFCYCLGADLPSALIADVVAGAGLAALRGGKAGGA
ncbi:MAG: hypothetical protein M3Q71_05720 [Chloroflexota bacterium]|nr:hypothetical protein [Chloroflexota bacterium]